MFGTQALQGVDLAGRRHFRDHDPDAQLARHGLGGGAVVAGYHRDLQAHRAQGGQRRAAGRLDRIGDGEKGGCLPVERQVKRRPPLPGQFRRRAGKRAERHTLAFEITIRAQEDGAAGDGSGQAVTRHRFHVGGLRRAQSFRRPQDGRRDRVLRSGFERGGHAQDRLAIKAGGENEIGQFRPAERERAGLVEGDDRGLAEGLQRVAAPEQQAAFGPAPGGDEDGGRRGEPHRAGAGHDQHADRVNERGRKRRRRGQHEPGEERGKRHAKNGRHENRRHPVHLGLNGQLGALRGFHQPDDLGQDRIGPQMRRAHVDRPVRVDRAAHHLVARRLGDRHRLAGDHRFIDERPPLDHLAINRDAFARPDAHAIAGPHLRQREFHRRAVTDHARKARLETHKLTNGGTGPSAAVGFEPPSEKDQRHDHGRRLEIDLPGVLRQPSGQEGRNARIKESRLRAERDQRVHVRSAAQEGGKTKDQEPPSRPEQDGRRQGKEQEVEREGTEPLVQGMVERRIDMPAHLEQEHRKGKRQRPVRIAGKPPRLSGLARLGGARAVPLALRVRRIAGRFDRRNQSVDRDEPLGRGDDRPVDREIDVCSRDARHGCQRLFHPRHAGRAGQPFEVEQDLRFPNGVAGFPHAFGEDGQGGRFGKLDLRQTRQRVDARAPNARRRGKRLLDPGRAGGAGHPRNGQATDRRALGKGIHAR